MPVKKENHQFHNLTDAEARQKEQEMTEELFRLRMRKSIGQLENPMNIRHLRRDIARLKTIQHARALRGTGE